MTVTRIYTHKGEMSIVSVQIPLVTNLMVGTRPQFTCCFIDIYSLLPEESQRFMLRQSELFVPFLLIGCLGRTSIIIWEGGDITINTPLLWYRLNNIHQ